MIFMEADWDWWIQKKEFSSQWTGNYRVQEILNVISSSSRMFSSTSLTVSWKVWLINEITSNLQRHNFDRRTNQGTPQHFCEKIQHWYLKICTRTINTLRHSDGVTWGSFEIIIFASSSEPRVRHCELLFTSEQFKFPWNRGCLQNVQEVFF